MNLNKIISYVERFLNSGSKLLILCACSEVCGKHCGLFC